MSRCWDIVRSQPRNHVLGAYEVPIMGQLMYLPNHIILVGISLCPNVGTNLVPIPDLSGWVAFMSQFWDIVESKPRNCDLGLYEAPMLGQLLFPIQVILVGMS